MYIILLTGDSFLMQVISMSWSMICRHTMALSFYPQHCATNVHKNAQTQDQERLAGCFITFIIEGYLFPSCGCMNPSRQVQEK